MPSLILASTSPYRKALLARLGIGFTQAAPNVDEAPLMTSGLAPEEIASRLARAKAESLANDSAHVLGADQLVELDGEIFGKPGSAAKAEAQLRTLSGKTHRLLTAFALRAPDGDVDEGLHVHQMSIRDLSDEEIERYIAADQPLDCCGAYKIESLGISLFERIVGDDPSAIEGLPLMALSAMLRRAGFALP